MISVYRRTINGKKSDWVLDSIYADGCEGGEYREKEYGNNFLEANGNSDERVEYKIEVTNNEWFFKRYYKRNR